MYKKDGRYKIVVKELVNELLASAPIKEAAYESAINVKRYKCVDSQDAYNTWKNTEYAEWEAQYNQAVANQKTTSDTNQQIFTADIEGQIKFYDALFSSIVDKGWVYNNQVSDSDYLNQCLQNNIFTITTVTTSLEYDSSKTVSENKTTYDFTFWWDNSYEESIASNFDHMILMNDENAEEEALAEFEREKSIISQKEARIDRKMEELQTELAANKQMLEGIQKVKNDNIERNFSIFG